VIPHQPDETETHRQSSDGVKITGRGKTLVLVSWMVAGLAAAAAVKCNEIVHSDDELSRQSTRSNVDGPEPCVAELVSLCCADLEVSDTDGLQATAQRTNLLLSLPCAGVQSE
jgi:hypothetical protein